MFIGRVHLLKTKKKMSIAHKKLWQNENWVAKRKKPEYTKAYRLKLSISKFGENNPMWKGDNVGIKGLHPRITKRIKKPTKCPKCNKLTKKLDLTNISGLYKTCISDWEWLCRRCHMLSDGRLEIMIERNKIKLIQWSKKYKSCVRCQTTSKKHKAKGLCFFCYEFLKRQRQ